MDQEDTETPVHLVIKSLNQNVSDQKIDCALGWTVRKLKNKLAKVYPTKPKPNKQKLIYSGQSLENHLILKDVLNHTESNDEHILHLAYSNSKDDSQNDSTLNRNTEPIENVVTNDVTSDGTTTTDDDQTESPVNRLARSPTTVRTYSPYRPRRRKPVTKTTTHHTFNVHITEHYPRPAEHPAPRMTNLDIVLISFLLLLFMIAAITRIWFAYVS